MTDHGGSDRTTKGVGPFEDLGDEQVMTFSCSGCDSHHNREEYEEVRQEPRDGIVVRIYRCPKGHEIELDMRVVVSENPDEAVYVELDPKEKSG
ncbi:hypothetical protein WMF26_31080 [Sorangium sp. So ce185]|uniref:hypothetical protein n=1 Tax=Sorangium sp. So ce185 TaxID=3133287 RepID=UPI003F60498A